jgi:prepilin-type N-terminal cleavage/methylation domain-containing protein
MKRSTPVQSSAAFTLVELLVVIAIIVILMSLLLTAVPAVKEAARKTEARNTVNQVVVAMNAYYTEYAKFPPTQIGADPSAGAAGDTTVGDSRMGATAPNNAVFFTLRNIPMGPNMEYAANPRKVVFYDGKSANVSGSGRARGGFYDRTESGGSPGASEMSCLFDPWGNQYGVVMDSDGDDRIDLTGIYTDFTGADPASGQAPRRKVGAFSMGKDEKLGTKGDRAYRRGSEKSDDVLSWEE